ncbi:MAG TPA: RNA polymerase sigma factor [Thermoanaerobaculia bacterium]|nr:RNA polymerase sigma factor [Thermoanaerobaculia bacterium]
MERAELEVELERLHAASFGWALGCCGRNRDDAEEVLQTVYLKVLDGRARFDGRSSLKTWLFAVIRRTAMAERRTRWLRSLAMLRAPDHPREEHDIERDCERSEEAVRLVAALRRLARRQREVLELVFYHDMTIEEAGLTLRISLGSARVHYTRGKKRLEALLTHG